MVSLNCPQCNAEAVLKFGGQIYPHRPDLRKKRFYGCPNCPDYYVGTHADGKPLGVLANKEHRLLKMMAHNRFDKFWKDGKMKRREAYQKLANCMEIKVEHTHIGWFSPDQCKQVMDIVSEWD